MPDQPAQRAVRMDGDLDRAVKLLALDGPPGVGNVRDSREALGRYKGYPVYRDLPGAEQVPVDIQGGGVGICTVVVIQNALAGGGKAETDAAEGLVGGLAAGGIKIIAGKPGGILSGDRIAYRIGYAAARAFAVADGENRRKGLAINGAAGEGDLYRPPEILGGPEGQVRQIGRGAVKILGGGGHPGAHAAGAGPVVVKRALIEVRQGLEADVVQPLPGEGFTQAGKVRQFQL